MFELRPDRIAVSLGVATKGNADREPTSMTLERIVSFLESNAAVRAKAAIQDAYAPAIKLSGKIRLGDDCAAVPDGDGFILFAAEGMLETFIADDPWFAGYSAVMVNLSDIAAMGGRPIAIVDVLWSPNREKLELIWEGMRAASAAYRVPIVGGHTTITEKEDGPCYLAASVIGRAPKLITSFDATAGDDLMMAVDLRGSYRGEKPFWNASVDAPSDRLRADLEILPLLAERDLCRAGKDISNGGIAGTLSMLLECSQMGAELRLDAVPMPPKTELTRWLVSFPSYGYLLSVHPTRSDAVRELFLQRGIDCEIVGKIVREPGIRLTLGQARADLRWH